MTVGVGENAQRYRATAPRSGGRPGRVVQPPSGSSSSSRRASRRSSTRPGSSAPTPAPPAPSGRSPARRRRHGPPPGTAAPPSSARAARAAGSGSRGRRTALHEPDVPRLALRVPLAAADGNQHAVAVGRVVDVGPPEGAHLAPPNPGHEGRSPPMTASRRPRSRATWPDSTLRPRRRGRWQVARTTARSAAPNGHACPRPRSPAVRR